VSSGYYQESSWEIGPSEQIRINGEGKEKTVVTVILQNSDDAFLICDNRLYIILCLLLLLLFFITIVLIRSKFNNKKLHVFIYPHVDTSKTFYFNDKQYTKYYWMLFSPV
jgi:hypothetical protein